MVVQYRFAVPKFPVKTEQRHLMAVQSHYAGQVTRARLDLTLAFPNQENSCVPDPAGRREKRGSAAQ